jgi:hypothetical protein
VPRSIDLPGPSAVVLGVAGSTVAMVRITVEEGYPCPAAGVRRHAAKGRCERCNLALSEEAP